MTLWWTLGSLVVAGGLIGFLAGLFGVGGGAISVPVLFETFRVNGLSDDISMPLAVGTSLAMIIPTGLVSAREHARRGSLDTDLLRVWCVPILVGVGAGSVIAGFAAPEVFQAVFACVAGLLSVKMLLGKTSWRIGHEMPGAGLTAAYGAVVGLLSSLMGIGGGSISNLIMTLYGRSVREAVSTSAGVGVLIAVPGALGYMVSGWATPGLPPYTAGFVSFLALAPTIPTALLSTRFGVQLAHAIPDKTLGRVFGVFLAIVAARFIFALTS